MVEDNLEKKRILIIEDDIAFANALSSHLEDSGFEIAHSKNIDEGLEKMREFRPQGITLDLQYEHGPLGVNIFKILFFENNYLDYLPTIIVVSTMLTADVNRVLDSYQIQRYDKNSPNFKFSLVSDSFLTLLDDSVIKERGFQPIIDTTDVLPTGEALRGVIHKKLHPYCFNIKSVSYERLIHGICRRLEEGGALSLVEIYGFDYHNAYKGIRKLLIDAHEKNPASFQNFFHASEGEIKRKRLTFDNFVYHIVTEIRNEYY